jgi:hypothetical protein
MELINHLLVLCNRGTVDSVKFIELFDGRRHHFGVGYGLSMVISIQRKSSLWATITGLEVMGFGDIKNLTMDKLSWLRIEPQTCSDHVA